MSKFVSIAIDGPAGAGKSTMAKACAKELGYLYVDTGAIYRTVGYYMRLMGVGPKDKDGIARLIDEVNIDIRYEDGVQHMLLNGADVTGEIRTPEMSMYASGVSAQLISMIPYVVTVIVLVLFVGKSHVPAANGKPYIKSK